ASRIINMLDGKIDTDTKTRALPKRPKKRYEKKIARRNSSTTKRKKSK
ncbi:hypothetical protein HGB24_03310, partial [Candidatus Saccharibacteria bacterium]|nr:hypothetical protein [Candidatus Saccharibacteria bacterium]